MLYNLIIDYVKTAKMKGKRKMPKRHDIGELERKIGYAFRDRSLLLQALTRTSYVNEHRGGGQSNEVLEFFGDSVLSCAIVTLFVNDYTERFGHGIKTKFAEGEFTVIKSKLSDKKNLSKRAREIGLGNYLRMGEGDAKLGIADEASVLEDALESIVGAVYIDSGMDMAKVISVVSGMLDIKRVLSEGITEGDATKKSAKNRLQEWCADKKRRLPQPIYETVGESGPEHKKTYVRRCTVGEGTFVDGSGKNLKEADADAAEKMLAILAKDNTRVKKNDEKQGENDKGEIIPDALAKLREYAKSQKLLAPSFKDLGETDRSNNSIKEYAVKCNFHGKEAVGVGSDKSTARAASAGKMLECIGVVKKEKKNTNVAPRVKKFKKENKKNIHRKG